MAGQRRTPPRRRTAAPEQSAYVPNANHHRRTGLDAREAAHRAEPPLRSQEGRSPMHSAEHTADPWDPWTDTRPVEMRVSERQRRFAPINAAFAAAKREEKQLRRLELARFKREDLTPGELLQ